jgi:threonine/homoserine/homoserine lactone efflux protein
MPIGPVNVEIARRALRGGAGGGFWPAVAVGGGASTIDVTYAIISSFGVAPLANSRYLNWPLTIGGLGLLAYLGISSIRGARTVARAHILDQSRPRPPNAPAPGGLRAIWRPYLTGLLLTGLSPFTIAFWFIVLPKYAGSITGRPMQDLPIIVVGVFVATLGWVFVFAGLLAFAGRWRRPWWLVAADEVGGWMLLLLAAGAFLRSIRGLL